MSLPAALRLAMIAGGLFWAGIWPAFARDGYVLAHFAPGAMPLALYVLCAAGIALTRGPALQLVLALWLLWPVLGSWFAIGHHVKRHLWAPLDLGPANLVFMVNVAALVAGACVASRLRAPRRDVAVVPWTRLDVLPLALFVPLYAASLLLSGPTLVTGGAVAEAMYAADRGPLYAYRLALVLAAGLAAAALDRAGAAGRRALGAGLVLLLAAALLDGKRDMAMMGVLTFVLVLALDRPARRAAPLLAGLAAAIPLYALVALMRAGGEAGQDVLWLRLATIAGVEYRDFAHGLMYWPPEYMRSFGYDFWRSSAAMLVNGQVLEALGIDKRAWIVMDSARSWQRAFEADVGIRVGLVAELHYQLGAWSVAGFAMLGAAAAWVQRVTVAARSDLGRAAGALVLASLALAVMSQATVLFGQLLTLGYLAAALILWRLVIRWLMSPGAARRRAPT